MAGQRAVVDLQIDNREAGLVSLNDDVADAIAR